MTYEQLTGLKPSDFKRKSGVDHETFNQMVEVLKEHLDRAPAALGPPERVTVSQTAR